MAYRYLLFIDEGITHVTLAHRSSPIDKILCGTQAVDAQDKWAAVSVHSCLVPHIIQT